MVSRQHVDASVYTVDSLCELPSLLTAATSSGTGPEHGPVPAHINRASRVFLAKARRLAFRAYPTLGQVHPQILDELLATYHAVPRQQPYESTLEHILRFGRFAEAALNRYEEVEKAIVECCRFESMYIKATYLSDWIRAPYRHGGIAREGSFLHANPWAVFSSFQYDVISCKQTVGKKMGKLDNAMSAAFAFRNYGQPPTFYKMPLIASDLLALAQYPVELDTLLLASSLP